MAAGEINGRKIICGGAMKMRNTVKSLIKHKMFYVALLVLTILLVAGCKQKMTIQDYLDLG